MNAKFAELVESLEPSFQRLVQMSPVTATTIPRGAPKRGIYLFSRGAEHLYVGRSNNIKKRIGLHCRQGSQHNQATFAFRMTRKLTGHLKASYTAIGSRAQLMQDATFSTAFDESKAQIRTLALRFVEENDATRQALLEIYVATVLDTPFNDFENH